MRAIIHYKSHLVLAISTAQQFSSMYIVLDISLELLLCNDFNCFKLDRNKREKYNDIDYYKSIITKS